MGDNIFFMENMTATDILSTVDPHRVLAALGEPNRLRMIELLAVAPRTVGEIAKALDIRQPQTTKHLQTLEAVDLVVVHRLGKRRVASLQRSTVRELADLLSVLGVANPSETVLEQYERAIRVEEQRLSEGKVPAGRTFHINRTVAASAASLWQAWTTPDLAGKWRSPEHFEVVDCELEAVVGGRVELTIQEGDGARYTSRGEVLGVIPGRKLTFSQAPVDDAGAPMFVAIHDLVIDEAGSATTMSLTVRIHSGDLDGAVLAGIPMGWEQCFDKLAALLETS
jgi:uncharacterized protein YndB with AHSA1/START domain/DNA-binding transcriptional ArsR family regulator